MVPHTRYVTFVLERFRVSVRVHSNSEWQVDEVINDETGGEVDFYTDLTDAQRDAIDAEAVEQITNGYAHWADILFEQFGNR